MKTNKFDPSRRAWLAKAGMASLGAGLITGAEASIWQQGSPINFPVRNMFEYSGTFINSAYTHPMSKGSLEALKRFMDQRLFNGKSSEAEMGTNRTEARAKFGKLINAKPEELAWIPSTMVGENLILSGLGIPGSRARVVTDAYHFDGSLFMYGELAKQGIDLHVIRPKENAIDLKDMEAAITPGTRLVALSLVSTVNGFQHDLKAVCEIAHAKGAFVFADIIQAAGAIPIDVKASGVDFCSCSTYKWLMGDFGVGFLYVRPDRLDQLKKVQYGYRQISNYVSHTFPFDPPGDKPFDSQSREDTGGHFEVGTLGNGGVAAVNYSLGFLLEAGVDNIQKYRQPMIDKLQAELPRLGFTPMTPLRSQSSIVGFAIKDAAKLKPRLQAGNVSISVYENRVRISPSFFNEMKDIDRLLEVLS